MASKAQYGRGTTLGIGATPTLVAEIKSIKLSGRKQEETDVTSLDSVAREFVGTIADSGSWSLEGNRVGTDAGQLAMETAFASGAVSQFTITLPKTGTQTKGDTFTFLGLITGLNYSVGVTEATTFSAEIKISGPLTITPGATA
jgi:hypothetical protein